MCACVYVPYVCVYICKYMYVYVIINNINVEHYNIEKECC